MNCSEDFGPFDKTWINCSHQGALPRVAADAAREAIAWKQAPYNLTSKRFTDVPARLRTALSKLVGAPEDEIALANSASYGLHLLTNGIPLRDGDEVLLVRGDFPSVILPWLGLEQRGIAIRHLEPPLDPEKLAGAITNRSRVLCTTWVHSFTGVALDLDSIGAVCRERGMWFVVNGAQAVGARPIDVTATPIDALVSVGFKWLCGPYGTGFCWMRPALRDSLEVNRAYWLAMQTADDLGKEDALPTIRDDLSARAYDIFGTANFFNFMPWTASLEYLLDKGIENIAAHDTALVERLIEGLARRGYRVLSPAGGRGRSTLVLASHPDRSRNETIHTTLKEHDIEIAYRRGNLRFSPHLYNTIDDVDRALDALPP
jgi:cysteine desulfurase/selenocysteine lyase